MRKPAFREAEQLIPNRARCDQNAITTVTLRNLFDHINQCAPFIRVGDLIKAIKEKEKRILFEQNIKHMGVHLNCHTSQNDLSCISEDACVWILGANLREIVQLDA